MSSRHLLDTNILIRFLTNDSKEQAQAVDNLFQKAGKKSLAIPDVVLVEAVFVLLSVYELPKTEIIEKLSSLLTFPKFDLHKTLFQKTLDLYSQYPISFVDAYIGAKSSTKPKRSVYTFDKKLLSIKSLKTLSPVYE